MSWKVKIDYSKCTGAGECVLVCPVDVFEMKNDKGAVTGEEWCIGCESCMEVCPARAITVWYED
jgi:NAD-dependent dihydropyrimidine dehydrogenase PreA subunit